MKLQTLIVGPIQTNCYVLQTDDSKTIVIDPGYASKEIESCFEHLDFILLTHSHWDHLLALPTLKNDFPSAKVCVYQDGLYSPRAQIEMMDSMSPYLSQRFASKVKDLPEPDIILEDGSMIEHLRVIHTPGHSKGSVCFYWEEENILFSGDTLFAQGYGRTDFQGGSIGELFDSIQLLLKLPPRTRLLSGHGIEGTIQQAAANLG